MLKCMPNYGAKMNSWFLILIHSLPQVPYMKPIQVTTHHRVGQDSSVGTATRYKLNSPGIESQWGARVFAPIQTGPKAHPASCIMGTGSFLGLKRLGHGFDQPPHPQSSDEVEG